MGKQQTIVKQYFMSKVYPNKYILLYPKSTPYYTIPYYILVGCSRYTELL